MGSLGSWNGDMQGAGWARHGPVLQNPPSQDTSEVPAGAAGWWWAQHCVSFGSCGGDHVGAVSWALLLSPRCLSALGSGGGWESVWTTPRGAYGLGPGSAELARLC